MNRHRAPYVPTHADYVTGRKLADLRRLAGETLRQTVDRANLPFDSSTLSRIENGKRGLSDPEATKLAAHFNTTTDKIIIRDRSRPALAPFATYSDAPAPTLDLELANPAPATVAVLDRLPENAVTLTIDLDNPMHPDDYRLSVWLPYLEARYNEDERKN